MKVNFLSLQEMSNLRQKIRLLLTNLLHIALNWIWGRKNKDYVPRTLLIIRLDEIGDYILFRNFLKVIRNSDRFRGYKMVLCGNAAWKDLAEEYDRDYVDEFVWLSKNVKRAIEFEIRLLKLAYKLRKMKFEVLINPVHSRTLWMDRLARYTGANWKIASVGDCLNIDERTKRLTDKFYDELIPTLSRTEFEFYRNRKFIAGLIGKEDLPKLTELEVRSCDRREKRIVIAPGANGNRKRWGGKNYGSICRRIMQYFPSFEIAVVGSSKEVDIAEEVIKYAGQGRVTNLVGKLSLPELVKVISSSALLISNESSPAHIAAAVGTPFICISNGNNFGRFHPYPNNMVDYGTYIYPDSIEAVMKQPNGYGILSERYKGQKMENINSISIDKVYCIVENKVKDFLLKNLCYTS